MSRSMGRIVLGTLFAAGMSVPVPAATPTPEDRVKSRILSFKELAAAFKNVNDELKKDEPRAMYLQISAREIVTSSRDLYSWFPAGTAGPKVGAVASKAKPDIWTKAPQFKATQDAFATEAKQLADAVATGDHDKMRAQARALGQVCSDCHSNFRTD